MPVAGIRGRVRIAGDPGIRPTGITRGIRPRPSWRSNMNPSPSGAI